MSLSLLRPLLDVEAVRFYSLQKGVDERLVEALPEAKRVSNLGPELRDLADTAAVISELDLVIAVDTAVAHLSGALGKAVWVLLPEPADWRWPAAREDSPWYPTARLFRQKRRGDWGEVIERVKEALGEWVAAGGKAEELPRRTEPVAKPRGGLAPRRIAGLSAVTEARVGIVQYFPDDEPVGSRWSGTGSGCRGSSSDAALGACRWGGDGGGGGGGGTRDCVGGGAGAGGALVPVRGAAGGEAGAVAESWGEPDRERDADAAEAGGAGAAGEGTETLDELQLTRLDWLKVNAPVEAQAILAGGEETLWRLRPVLLLGVADEAELRCCAERVKGFGYRCWRIETPLYNPANFNRRDDDLFAGHALALAAVPEEMDAGAMASDLREA